MSNSIRSCLIDIDVCRQWAEIREQRSRAGMPISPQDAWIAATALRYNVVLVSHNPGDYQAIPGLRMITEVEQA